MPYFTSFIPLTKKIKKQPQIINIQPSIHKKYKDFQRIDQSIQIKISNRVDVFFTFMLIKALQDHIIKSSMSSFKGLLPKNLTTDDSFGPINKKIQDYRKVASTSLDYFNNVARLFETQAVQLQKIIQQLKLQQDYPQYYKQLVSCFMIIHKQGANFTERIQGLFRQMTKMFTTIFSEYSNSVLLFQQQVRNYQHHQQIAIQLSKKYFRSLKSITVSIEAYKNSFSDVKLIYNNHEKIKRYAVCQNDYQTISQDYQNVIKQVDKLNEIKDSIRNAYDQLSHQLNRMVKSMGSRQISECKNFTNYYCDLTKTILTLMAQQKINLHKTDLSKFWPRMNKETYQQYFKIELNPAQCQQIPCLIFYHKQVKDQFLSFYLKSLGDFAKQVQNQCQARRQANRKVYDFISNFMKIQDKSYLIMMKQSVALFEKNKKKIGEYFGVRKVSFVKSINSLLQLTAGLTQKNIKNISANLLKISQFIIQQNNLLDLITKQVNAHIQKLIGKKELKKKLSSDILEFTQQQNSFYSEKDKQQIAQKIQFLIILISGFRDKLKTGCEQIKSCYNDVINNMFLNNNEIYSLSCQYKTLYFGPDEFEGNFKKYEIDLEAIMVKNQEFFKDINFGSLLKDTNKIVFDGQVHKFQEFKKLKKPASVEVKMSDQSTNETTTQTNLGQSSNPRLQSKESNKLDLKLIGDKNLQFIASKTTIRPGQQIVNIYNCAFSDKIILQGKMYITTERICFHSKFNPNTVFFGGTFIQIPKEDIKKIEKRSNVLLFDNSISLTTINGEMLFTSFFSRDEAYNQICKTFEIMVDFAFIEQPQTAPQVQQVVQTPQQDDMKEQETLKRKEQLQNLSKEYPYKEIYSEQLNSEGINPLKILKLFYADQQMTINRRNYSSFNHYLKQLFENKQIDIPQWEPNLKEYFNSANIKNTTPSEFKKKVSCVIPISGANIPFMPKFANSCEQMSLRIISKNQWYILTRVTSSGAPYTDTFEARLKYCCKVVDQNTVRFQMDCFVNIFKRTIASSTIESKTPDDTINATKKIIQEIKRYLKYLQKQKKKQNCQNGDNNNNNNAIIQQLQNEIGQLKDSNEQLQKQLKRQKQTKITAYKVILGSIVLNIILLLILFN